MNLTTELMLRAEALGATLELAGDRVKVKGPQPLPSGLMADLRNRRDEIVKVLLRKPMCRNRLTPHASHEFYWECNLDECYCYRRYRRPIVCQGFPCRWVWPDGPPAD